MTAIALVLVAILIFMALLSLYHAFMLYLARHAPFIPIPKAALKPIVHALALSEGDSLYDLGCGDGRVLAAVARVYSNLQLTGVDSNPLAVFLARVRLRKTPHHQIVWGDMYNLDISRASRIFTFLSRESMALLEPVLARGLPAGSLLVCADFPLPHRPAFKVIALEHRASIGRTLYVYEY